MPHSEGIHENFKIQNADIQQMKTKTLVFKECTLKRSNESAVLKQNQPQPEISAFLTEFLQCAYIVLYKSEKMRY